MFFRAFLLKVIIVFINTVCALSLIDVEMIASLLLILSRWQSFPSRLRAFFDSKHLSAAVSIMIFSNVSNEPLAQLVVTKEPKFENKSHRKTFSFANNLYLPIF